MIVRRTSQRARRPQAARSRSALLWVSGLLLVAAGPKAAHAQAPVTGLVVDGQSGLVVSDAIIRIEGTLLSAATDDRGRFLLPVLAPGRWTLTVDHLAYGPHRHELLVREGLTVQVEIRLSREAIELDPLVVEVPTSQATAARARGASTHVVDRARIEAAVGTSKHLGDVVRQVVPGIRLRQSNQLTGEDVCLEFRAAATLSLSGSGCRSPLVFLDGVPMTDPTFLYGSLPLSTIEEIEVIPPGEAGARYGAGSLYGVILITSLRPGIRPSRVDPGPRLRRRTFDWDLDPEGHPTRRALNGGFAGNAIGLAAGLAVGRQCFDIDAKGEVVTRCGAAGNVGAAVAAIVLPAVAGALASRWAGATETSRGRLQPAVLGAALIALTGYAFALSTQGSEAGVVSALGKATLLIGVPAVLALADRLFRDLR